MSNSRDDHGTKSPQEKYYYNQAVSKLGQAAPTARSKKVMKDTTDSAPDPRDTSNEQYQRRPKSAIDGFASFCRENIGEIILMVLFGISFLLIKDLFDKTSEVNREIGQLQGKVESLDKRNSEIYEDFKEILRSSIRKNK